MLASTFMNTLTQYGESGGAGSGVFVKASFVANVPQTLTVASYQQLIQQTINSGVFPQAVNPVTSVGVPIIMIYLDQHTVINGGGRQLNIPGAADAAYHESFVTSNGNPCVYAFMAYFPIGTVTFIASHEFAESFTDPLYTAWTPDHAQHEIGDYCEGNNATITVSGRSWTVQTLWSNANKACIAPPAAPIPALPGGPNGAAASPGGARGFSVSAGQISSHQRVLPLPTSHFNPTANAHTMDPAEVLAYARKMFYPIKHEAMFGDFPTFLRTMADSLEQAASSGAPEPTADLSADVSSEPASDRLPGVARKGSGCTSC
jgi:hypothetical protein